MTGTLAISPGADAAGNASAVLVMGTRGTGAAHFRHTKAGSLFADIQSDADGIPRYVRYNTNGTVLSNKQILLTGDALGTGGGTVTGASIFSSTVEVNAPFFANTTGAIRDLTLLPSAGTEGGQVFFSPDTQALHGHRHGVYALVPPPR